MTLKLTGFLCATLLMHSALALKVDKKQVILEKLDDYEFCQSKDYDGDTCNEALQRWVEAHPDDAFTAGKKTRAVMNHWVAMPFFAKAFAQKKQDCKDDDVRLAVVGALNQPADVNPKVVAQAKKIAIETCYAEMKDVLTQEAKTDSYLFKNICKDLAAKGALSGLKLAKCNALK